MDPIELLTRYKREQFSDTKVPSERVQGVTIKAKDGVFLPFEYGPRNFIEMRYCA